MKTLPAYMVPSRIVILDRLPLTRNGKVARDALPAPELTALPQTSSTDDVKTLTLLDALRDIMNREDIGSETNFYHIGGDSIIAIQLASRLKKFGYRLHVKQILDFPVIREMVAAIEQDAES